MSQLTTCYTFFLFFFNDTATTEIYTLSLHDALPIWLKVISSFVSWAEAMPEAVKTANAASSPRTMLRAARPDRKSTRLNSSHTVISYAVFCLKKKKKKQKYNYKLKGDNDTNHAYTT